MWIYFSVVGICLIASLSRNKALKYYILFLFLLFVCCGYMTGSDWRNYELSYYQSEFKDLTEERFEIGYGLLQNICNYLSIDFWHFHILIKAFVFVLIIKLVSYVKVNILLFWALFLPELGLYLFIDCPFRNLIAFGIFCLSVPALLEQRNKYFVIVASIAVLFHYSALILFLLFFWIKFPLKNRYYIILFILANIFAYNVDYLLENVFSNIFEESDFFKDRLLVYALNEDFLASKINIGSIYRIIFFMLFIYYRPKIENMQYGRLLFSISMLFFVLYPFTISLKIFNRFAIYLLPLYLVAVVKMLPFMERGVRYIVLFVILGWTLLKTYTTITADYRYIPYSNYFQYLMQDKPSYKYRSIYNIQNSPYGKN